MYMIHWMNWNVMMKVNFIWWYTCVLWYRKLKKKKKVESVRVNKKGIKN